MAEKHKIPGIRLTVGVLVITALFSFHPAYALLNLAARAISPLAGLTEEDFGKLAETGMRLLDRGRQEDKASWFNNRNGHGGTIIMVEPFQGDGLECWTVALHRLDQETGAALVPVCRKPGEQWIVNLPHRP